jgi:hypothetical protein
MSALIPALIQLLLSGRRRGGGGGGGGGGSRRGGGSSRSGGSGRSSGYGRGRYPREPKEPKAPRESRAKPFDPQADLDKRAGQDMHSDAFKFGPDKPTNDFWNDIFKSYNNDSDIPEPEMPDPFKPKRATKEIE